MAALLSLMTLLGSCGGYPISVSSFRIHNTSVIPFAIPRNSASALERHLSVSSFATNKGVKYQLSLLRFDAYELTYTPTVVLISGIG
ncbi:hypothetical protein Tco_1194473 [Tanacetum coccineum]